MATLATTKAKKQSDGASAAKAKQGATGQEQDATTLLAADHREVRAYFEQYETLTDNAEKKALATKICRSLKVHTQIEEELFYPAARKATGDADLLDEAIVEHMGAKNIIAEIEAMQPGQNLYDAKINVLGEQIHHHVEEEEQELFPEVRSTKLDLAALGEKLAARKSELLATFPSA